MTRGWRPNRSRKLHYSAASVCRKLWCVECVCDNAEALHLWVYQGRATAQGGAVKEDTCCTTCGRALPAGTHAEAVTLHSVGQKFEPWEDQFVDAPES